MQQESNAIIMSNGQLHVSQTAVTDAGLLPAEFVIHTVGPVYQANMVPVVEQQLREAILSALRTAWLLCASSISLPPVSAGLFHYPVDEAAEVIFDAVADWFLYMGGTPEGELAASDLQQGLMTSRLRDRRANCTLPLSPSQVTLVAFHNVQTEVDAVSAAFNATKAAEERRRARLGVSPSQTYTIAPPLTATVVTTTTVASTAPTTATAVTDTMSSMSTMRTMSTMRAMSTVLLPTSSASNISTSSSTPTLTSAQSLSTTTSDAGNVTAATAAPGGASHEVSRAPCATA
jgi:hypothetical protein